VVPKWCSVEPQGSLKWKQGLHEKILLILNNNNNNNNDDDDDNNNNNNNNNDDDDDDDDDNNNNNKLEIISFLFRNGLFIHIQAGLILCYFFFSQFCFKVTIKIYAFFKFMQ
jgi:hypothetical protein